MSAANYLACMKQMLIYEGGYSNHPSDPGGVTLEGVIQTRYNEYRRAVHKPQKALVPSMRYQVEWIAERNAIYRKYYWDVVKGDSLPAGVDLAVFDYCVNSGPGRALPHFAPYRNYLPIPAIKALCARRLAFVRALRTWSVFGKGWGPRIANVEAVGVKMWLKFSLAIPSTAPTEAKKRVEEVINKELTKEATKADTTAKGQVGTGGAVATGTGGTVAADPSMFGWDWMTIGLGAFVLGVGAFLGYRIYINLQRKKAYLDAAATV